MTDVLVVKPEETPDPSKVPAGATVDKNGTVRLSTDTTPTPEAKPVWEQHGFKSADEMGKAYGELRTKMSKDGAPKDETPAATPTPEAAKKAVADAGLDMGELSREVAENGELSQPSKDALKAKGISEETAKQFIEGQKAVAQQRIAEIHKVAGSAEDYTQATKWAEANMTEAEVEAFNEALHSEKPALAKIAVQGLMSRYRDAVGSEGSLVNGSNVPGASGVQPFRSQGEIVAAMRDPRYENDSAYRADVVKRMERTTVLG